ncbi:hypothetical protein RRG08_007959 [Elysia crispata]|uniref:Uncharacterized protein n=1 Tax=Elysia crispata TaxID=231223 RepID=A0AAE0ZRW0_9GAST|nr:hypothetical protein RRG08_007959 [Elysia crispata]
MNCVPTRVCLLVCLPLSCDKQIAGPSEADTDTTRDIPQGSFPAGLPWSLAVPLSGRTPVWLYPCPAPTVRASLTQVIGSFGVVELVSVRPCSTLC